MSGLKGRVGVVNNPKSLKDLVELAVQRHDASGLALSQIAKKAGHPITYTTLNAIRQGTYKYIPREPTLRALAWLAGVSDEVAFTAAGQSVPGPPFAEELPPGVDNLPPKARRAVIDMLRVLVDMNQDANAGNAEDQEQPTDVGGAGTEPRNARSRQKTKRGLSAVPDDNGNIPLPDDYEQLAAHPATNSSGRREHEAGRERGEESQVQE